MDLRAQSRRVQHGCDEVFTPLVREKKSPTVGRSRMVEFTMYPVVGGGDEKRTTTNDNEHLP